MMAGPVEYRAWGHTYACTRGPNRFNRSYWQVGNLKDAILVLQLKDPFAFRYWLTYQNVQSSTGSMDIVL